MHLTGYTDRLSVAPGEPIEFMVSSEAPEYEAQLVRLFHGDRNPAGPGFKEEPLGASVDGGYRGRRQATHPGSHAVVGGLPSAAGGFGLAAWVYPTAPRREERQCIAARRSPDGAGFTLFLAAGRLRLSVGTPDGELLLAGDEELAPRRWHFFYAGHDGERLARLEHATTTWPLRRAAVEGELPGAPTAAPGWLSLAAEAGAPGRPPRDPFDGKIASPRLYCRALGEHERAALERSGGEVRVADGALLGEWALSPAPGCGRFLDRSGHHHDGVLVNCPATASTDHRWDGTSDLRDRPEHFEAVHFHRDDLGDAGWEADFRWRVPAGLASGVYAARLRAGGREDHIPFVVRPPRDRAGAEVALLLPTFTYLAYGNERMIETSEEIREKGFPESDRDPRDAEWAEHPEYGISLYDLHADGSGCCYASARRPILNLRPDYRMWVGRAPRGLGSDLYMVDWLREKGFDHDTLTDGDVHEDGAELLRRYRVLITGSHPEYWSEAMLRALESYLDGGGRLMYLGGNGFYWVTSVDPVEPHPIEVRRGHAGTRVFESAPGETCHGTSGERGGLWRHRGKSPNGIVGVGFAAQGVADSSPGYRRTPGLEGPISELVFDGVEEDPIGAYGLVMGGAAGDEFDRADPRLGTPPHALVLASATGFPDSYQLAVEDVMQTAPGLGGSQHPDVRSDIVFMETPNDGAVFSAGSMNWSGSLSHGGYDNGVSRITENVLRAFLSVSAWPAEAENGVGQR